jgi:hypothetical protein
MHGQMIGYIFWWVPPAVMIAIAAYMLHGMIHREFPCFFNYLVFQIAAFVVEFALLHQGSYSYYFSCVITALGSLFSFAVLVELVKKIVDGTQTLRHWNISLFCWCAAATMVVIEVWPLTSSLDDLTHGIVAVARTIRVAQIALAFFIVMFGAAVGFRNAISFLA